MAEKDIKKTPAATQTVQPSTEGSAATTSDAQTEDTGVATADTMRAVPFVLMMFAAMTAFVVLAGRKKKEEAQPVEKNA